jgi:hypothetical protein
MLSNSQINDEKDNNKKSRGRPRKNQIMADTDKSKKSTQDNKIKLKFKDSSEDEIILHLPISLKDLNNEIFESSNNQIADETDKNDKTDINTEINDSNVFTINDNESEGYCNENDSLLVEDLKSKIKQMEATINQYEKDINEYKAMLNNTTNNDRKVTKINMDLIDNATGKPLEIKTDIVCWWCTHDFDTIPCFLPEKLVNDKYFVFGCFCSCNCAASYNISLGDSCIWNRYSLLKKLYNTEISIAPARESFKKFGGPLSFEEYSRNSKKCSKKYRFIMPPMTSIVPLIEEGCGDSTKVNISLADLNKRTVLRRNKPLPSTKNNLFESLGMTFGK